MLKAQPFERARYRKYSIPFKSLGFESDGQSTMHLESLSQDLTILEKYEERLREFEISKVVCAVSKPSETDPWFMWVDRYVVIKLRKHPGRGARLMASPIK